MAGRRLGDIECVCAGRRPMLASRLGLPLDAGALGGLGWMDMLVLG